MRSFGTCSDRVAPNEPVEKYHRGLRQDSDCIATCGCRMRPENGSIQRKKSIFRGLGQRAHRLAGAQTRSAEHRTRIEQNQGVIHRTPAPPPPLTNTAPLQPFEPPVGGGALEWRGGGDKGSRVGEERGGGGHYSARLRKFEQMCPFDQHAAYHALEDRFTILSCFLSGISRGYHCVDVFLDFERCPILPHV